MVKRRIINNNISLQVNHGDIIGLIGESGCGKTTLAKIVAGIEKQDSGDIFFENKKITKQNRKDIKNEIQIIFQNHINALNPKMSVIDLVSEPLLLDKENRKNKNQINKKVKEMLNYVKLDEILYQRKSTQLSGGHCQRIAIARALVTFHLLFT